MLLNVSTWQEIEHWLDKVENDRGSDRLDRAARTEWVSRHRCTLS